MAPYPTEPGAGQSNSIDPPSYARMMHHLRSRLNPQANLCQWHIATNAGHLTTDANTVDTKCVEQDLVATRIFYFAIASLFPTYLDLSGINGEMDADLEWHEATSKDK